VYADYAGPLKRRFKWLRPSLFVKELAKDLRGDVQALLNVLKTCGEWDPARDAKLDALWKLLTQKHPGDKVLLFSQFADTVRYLEGQLRGRGLDRLAGARGASADPTALAWRFSPDSNQKRGEVDPGQELRVLLATDVLSEGQNLQDCAVVVNYDLPWAIIRLIQRAGRVDRIGQKAENILCYSFLPAEGVERIIRLRARVRQRLKENAEVVGTDEAFFEDDHKGPTVLDLYHEKAGILDGDDMEIDLVSEAYQIWKNAITADPTLQKIIPEMPPVVFATRQHQPTESEPSGVLVYLRTAEGNDALAWMNGRGESVTESQLAILKDRHSANLAVALDGKTFTLQAVAEKRGLQVFECPCADGDVPAHRARSKVERQVAKSAHEHIIIYTDPGKTVQKWQWVRRELGRPLARREHDFRKGQTGELLVQKLQQLAFTLDEEEQLTLPAVTGRVRAAFDVDRVTKRFYDRFKTEHAAFLNFIKGITSTADREWYASLMMNRLMFVYFIQKKGFLAGDPNYLRSRLRMVQQSRGKDKFLTFYRYFLLRLFHEGLAQPPAQRTKDLEQLLGEVPYLNGGLFDVHELEEANPDLQIADEAFERLFGFFDDYQWHLDERPLRADSEINPDVLGYIFEKYINQKQMGAYYTKEDITGYIARNTIIPFLFDAARKKCAVAFEPDSAVWRLLRDDPDRYIHDPVRLGVIDKSGAIVPETALPDFAQRGMRDPKERRRDRHYNLGQANPRDAAGEKLTLPTETWREYVSRRQRCLELRGRLHAGDIHEINDLVTLNLDVCQFAEDVIENCEGPELLRAFWQAINGASTLDPACGSGAFLFAALTVLEPLYEASLDRMQAFLDDLERSGERHRPEKFSDFRKVLEEVARHPNRRYFILKSIIINNLYGVDIMEEAVEICKLRLFLKLVAQVDKVKHLEPLPDIDFNIRAGNTLVGFATLADVQKTLEGTLGFARSEADRIVEEADIVNRAFRMFRAMQTEYGMDAKKYTGAKVELRQRFGRLREELDRYLAGEYGVDPGKQDSFRAWRDTHKPFHWFAEFYGIMSDGGFDVIIGNPPYFELNVLTDYEPRGFACKGAGNIYALFLERSASVCSSTGKQGFIVPVSSVSTDRYASLQNLLLGRQLHYSSFDDRPLRWTPLSRPKTTIS
jgi:hypothetical protein